MSWYADTIQTAKERLKRIQAGIDVLGESPGTSPAQRHSRSRSPKRFDSRASQTDPDEPPRSRASERGRSSPSRRSSRGRSRSRRRHERQASWGRAADGGLEGAFGGNLDAPGVDVSQAAVRLWEAASGSGGRGDGWGYRGVSSAWGSGVEAPWRAEAGGDVAASRAGGYASASSAMWRSRLRASADPDDMYAAGLAGLSGVRDLRGQGDAMGYSASHAAAGPARDLGQTPLQNPLPNPARDAAIGPAYAEGPQVLADGACVEAGEAGAGGHLERRPERQPEVLQGPQAEHGAEGDWALGEASFLGEAPSGRRGAFLEPQEQLEHREQREQRMPEDPPRALPGEAADKASAPRGGIDSHGSHGRSEPLDSQNPSEPIAWPPVSTVLALLQLGTDVLWCSDLQARRFVPVFVWLSDDGTHLLWAPFAGRPGPPRPQGQPRIRPTGYMRLGGVDRVYPAVPSQTFAEVEDRSLVIEVALRGGAGAASASAAAPQTFILKFGAPEERDAWVLGLGDRISAAVGASVCASGCAPAVGR